MDHHHTHDTTTTMPMGTGMHHMHPTTSSNHSGHSGHQATAGHQGYFHFSDQAVVLFAGWKITSSSGMILSCVGIFFMAWFYEGLKILRERWFYKSLQRDRDQGITEITNSFSARCFGDHIIQTILHVIQITLSYFLMLIFMTYNGYLCIAVASGSGIGYLTFGWLRKTFQDSSDHCH